jgi:hypothetical protein
MNVFKNVKSIFAYSGCTLTEWFTTIQSTTYSGIITEIRKGNKQLKTSLPSIVYHFKVNGERNSNNITLPNDLLFFDIDDSEFDISKLYKNKIRLAYKSVSGTGYHIVVAVINLNQNNFKSVYNKIAKELGIDNVIDNSCNDVVRQAIISYDPNAYYNENSYVFNANDYLIIDDNGKKSVNSRIQKKKNTISVVHTPNYTSKIYTDNSHQIWEQHKTNDNDTHIYFPARTTNYIKVFLTNNKISDGRKTKLKAIITNLLFCNGSNVDEDRMIKYLIATSELQFTTPLPSEIIRSLYKEKVKEYNDGKLEPIVYNKQRMVIFNPYLKIDLETKKSIVMSLIRKEKGNNTIEIIKTFLETYITDFNDQKLTNKIIADKTGYSIDSIKRKMKTIMEDDYYAELLMINKSKFETRKTKYNRKRKQLEQTSNESSQTITSFPNLTDNDKMVSTTTNDNNGLISSEMTLNELMDNYEPKHNFEIISRFF